MRSRERKMLRQLLGLEESCDLPAGVVESYKKVEQMYHRVRGMGNMPMDFLMMAVLHAEAMGGAVPMPKPSKPELDGPPKRPRGRPRKTGNV